MQERVRTRPSPRSTRGNSSPPPSPPTQPCIAASPRSRPSQSRSWSARRTASIRRHTPSPTCRPGPPASPTRPPSQVVQSTAERVRKHGPGDPRPPRHPAGRRRHPPGLAREALSHRAGTTPIVAGMGADGVQDCWVGEAGEGPGDGHPDGVAGSRIGADHAFEPVRPSASGQRPAGWLDHPRRRVRVQGPPRTRGPHRRAGRALRHRVDWRLRPALDTAVAPRVAVMPPERLRTLPFAIGLVRLRSAPPIVAALRPWTSR